MADQIKGAPLANNQKTAQPATDPRPKQLTVTVADESGHVLAVIPCLRKTFASTKIGYGGYGKTTLPTGETVQLSLNLPIAKSDGKSF